MASAPIIILGAGIGGLTAALALARKGFRVLIYEWEPELSEIGAGLQLSPNASRVLLELGLGEKLKPYVGAPSEVTIRSAGGGDIARIPLGDFAAQRYGAPYWVIHRADLQLVLVEAVQADPNVTLELNVQVDDTKIEPGGVIVRALRNRPNLMWEDEELRNQSGDYSLPDSYWEDRFNAATETEGMALIAACGMATHMLHRVVQWDWKPRGDKYELKYSNRTAWRATVPSNAVPPEFRNPVVNLWLGRNAHLVHYPIRNGAAVNIVAITSEEAFCTGWSDREATLDRVLAHYPREEWSERAHKILASSDIWGRYLLFDRVPLERWSRGAATILGDTAHAMLPFLAQGAAMAVEDAAVLADCLHATPEAPEQAFRRYEKRRKPRTSRVQRSARRNGQVYHLGGLAAAARDFMLRRMSGEKLLTRYDWLYDWRPDTDPE